MNVSVYVACWCAEGLCNSYSEFAKALQADPPEWMAGAMRSAQIDVVPDPEMAQSAAQVRWRSGRMEYDLQAATNAVLTALKTAAEDYHEAPEKAG